MNLKLISAFLLLVSVGGCILLNIYPANDWVSAPMLTLMVMAPAISIETLLFLSIVGNYQKHIRLIFAGQALLSLFCIGIVIYYVSKH